MKYTKTIAVLFFLLAACNYAYAASLSFIDEPRLIKIRNESVNIMHEAGKQSQELVFSYCMDMSSALRFPINTAYRMASLLSFIESKNRPEPEMVTAFFIVRETLAQSISNIDEYIKDIQAMVSQFAQKSTKNSEAHTLLVRLEACYRDTRALLENMQANCTLKEKTSSR